MSDYIEVDGLRVGACMWRSKVEEVEQLQERVAELEAYHHAHSDKQEGEPIGFLQSSGVSQLSGGHPAKLYPIGATPSPFESSTLVYTHPASRQAVSVPQQWRDKMEELAADLESEIESRRSGELDRRIERDLIVVREARALLAEQEQDQ